VALQYYEMCENHGKDYGGWTGLTCRAVVCLHTARRVEDYGGWILTCPLPRSLPRPPCHIFVSSSVTFDASTAVSLPVFHTRPAAGINVAPVRCAVRLPPALTINHRIYL